MFVFSVSQCDFHFNKSNASAMDYTEVLTNIRRIVRSVNLESKRIEKEYGISTPQLLGLKFEKTMQHNQASQKDIKEFLSLNASTVTGIIARLERKGLVARLPRRDDRRVSYITLTARGADLISKTPVLIHDRLTQKLKGLSEDHLADLRRAFDLIADFLDSDTLDASPIITAELSLQDEDEETDT